MSKCREVYVAHCANDEQFHTPYDWWQAAWNAAIARAAEICYHEAGVYTKDDAARAIEREQEK